MQLPEKIPTAIRVLGQFNISPDRVVPFYYRLFLRLSPDTPPPLWGASKGYWDFAALLTALFWGGLATLILGYLTWQDIQNGESKYSGSWLLWQFVVWAVAGIFGWADACEKRRSAAREATVLGLPSWEQFHAQWRPSLENLRNRTEPVHYWLRSLWSDALVLRMGTLGMLSFVAVAYFIPAKAGSYGEGIAMAYVAMAVMGFSRTHKRKVLPKGTVAGERAAGWRCANGFWIGSVLAAVTWESGINQLVGYQPGYNTLFYAFAAFAFHASEAFSFYQQKGLALRAERAEQSRQLAEVRLQMLKSQIEPHFIFNTLAHLKALIKSNPAVAESMADELSDFLRASLKSLREDQLTVAQDFELVRAYLALARLRMGDRLQVELNLAPEVGQLPVPPLMLQTLVENAVQHGIEPKAGPGRITVSARLNPTGPMPYLELEVADDGAGFMKGGTSDHSSTGGSGLGLVNIRERLGSAFGSDATLTLRANNPNGVVATLRLPIAKSTATSILP